MLTYALSYSHTKYEEANAQNLQLDRSETPLQHKLALHSRPCKQLDSMPEPEHAVVQCKCGGQEFSWYKLNQQLAFIWPETW